MDWSLENRLSRHRPVAVHEIGIVGEYAVSGEQAALKISAGLKQTSSMLTASLSSTTTPGGGTDAALSPSFLRISISSRRVLSENAGADLTPHYWRMQADAARCIDRLHNPRMIHQPCQPDLCRISLGSETYFPERTATHIRIVVCLDNVRRKVAADQKAKNVLRNVHGI